ncbi:MAG: hypothetical protein DI535_21230 [Citrobacter freundii]|nr:MAG: hypothetical protein DI535_21230 [Citrobacter freundii]
MKKLMILPAALLFAGMVVNAQDNTEGVAKATMELKDAKAEKKEAKKELRELGNDNVSALAKDHFYTYFGDINATWRRTKYFDEASFVQDGKPMTAYYDIDAELVGTTTPSEFSAIPANAQRDIEKHFKGYDIGPVTLLDDNEANSSDMMLYGSSVSDEDNYFVELSKGNKTVILQVSMQGLVRFFKELKK